MAVYAWKGIDRSGKSVKGKTDAENPRQLRVNLKRQGVMVTELLEESEARRQRARDIDFKKLLQRVTTADLAMSTRQLATLIHSGIPLVQALTALIDQLDQEELKNAITEARDRVNEGKSFADALTPHSKIFPPLYINMVAAGEASGNLEAVLARLADFLDSQSKLKTKVSGALAYPAFMVILSVLIVVLMMTVVVPKITAIFEDFQQTLPWYTELLIAISDLMTSWWILVVIAIIALSAYTFQRWRNTPEGRLKWDQMILSAPLFGKLLLMVAVSRFARTLATLLASGVPVLSAMEITRRVLGNHELMKVVEDARASVREGESIAEPLKRSGRFPPIVTHMIAIGERSGKLEEMLENVANAYEVQVEARVSAMTSLLEPLVIVVMGGVTGSIAFAILMPLLKLQSFAE